MRKDSDDTSKKADRSLSGKVFSLSDQENLRNAQNDRYPPHFPLSKLPPSDKLIESEGGCSI